MLVGPISNPANLDAANDTILEMFNKIVTVGNADVIVSILVVLLSVSSALNTASHLVG